MLILFGSRTVCIKTDTDNHKVCSSCKSIGVDVFVYRKYFHLFFIPIVPSGSKDVKIYCSNCREPKWFKDNVKLYEQASRTPLYFYSGLIIITGLIILLVLANIDTQNEKAVFVANPREGDVYAIRKTEGDSTYYYFLRLSKIKGDSVWAFHNNLIYYSYINQFNKDDFFLSGEEMSFSKKELLEMLDDGAINAVDRNYSPSTGFDRIR